VKSKREIEKELWPLITSKPLDRDGHAKYVKFQRDFQKRLSEQLKHNPITVTDLLFRVDIVAEDVQKLLQMDMSMRKKRDTH
jgi:hypothetical protein